MAPLESSDLSPIARTQVSQPIPGQEKSDDQNSHGELRRHKNRHENLHIQKDDDGQVQLSISIFLHPELDPPQRHRMKSRNSETGERGITGEHAWRLRPGQI